MKQIQISEECFEQVNNLALKMVGQDMAATQYPIYTVQEKGLFGAWEDVNWYFSHAAAEAYITSAKHLHKGKLRLFVKSAHRNHEWRAICILLKEIQEQVK